MKNSSFLLKLMYARLDVLFMCVADCLRAYCSFSIIYATSRMLV